MHVLERVGEGQQGVGHELKLKELLVVVEREMATLVSRAATRKHGAIRWSMNHAVVAGDGIRVGPRAVV